MIAALFIFFTNIFMYPYVFILFNILFHEKVVSISFSDRFVMNVKLFVVMGMSWICEVVSFFLRKYLDHVHWNQVFFYTSDVFNCLQGLLIFILFVLKTRVYQALRKRLRLDTKKKPTPTCNATTTLHDPYRVRKSASSSTLTTTFAISSMP